MPETLPRWGMPDVNFIETDPEKIKSDIINRYESAAGRTLSAGDPVRLFLLTIASEIIQLRQVFDLRNVELNPCRENDIFLIIRIHPD